MYSFKTFLVQLRKLTDQGLGKDSVRRRFIAFVETIGAKILDPSWEELTEFLLYLRFVVLSEDDDGREIARSWAIGDIYRWVETRPESVFRCVTFQRCAFELALRVRLPQMLDQGQSDFCGQAGMVYLFAKEDPKGFVRFACELITTGQGRLRQMTVAPSLQVRALATPVDTPPTDYMLLSSIRNALDVTHPLLDGQTADVLRSALQSTQPTLLCGLLRRMGYRQVKSDCRALPTYFEAEHGLDLSRLVSSFVQERTKTRMKRTSFEAEDIFRYRQQLQWIETIQRVLQQGGYAIVMIDAAILENLVRNIWIKRMELVLRDERHLHYATVRKVTLWGPLGIELELHSWGRTYVGKMHKIDFLERFFGYITATP